MSKLKYIFDECQKMGLSPEGLYDLYVIAGKKYSHLRPFTPLHLEGFVLVDGDTWSLSQKGEELLKHLDTLIKGKAPKISPPIVVSEGLATEYREMWPEIKFPSGKYARTNVKSIIIAFQQFFKEYPAYTDWEIILKATELYLEEYRQNNWKYASTSQYFIAKKKEGGYQYILADYYERILGGEAVQEVIHFGPKVS